MMADPEIHRRDVVVVAGLSAALSAWECGARGKGICEGETYA